MAKQCAIVAEPERGSRHSHAACELLAQFEHMQVLNVANRDRLRQEFGIRLGQHIRA